MASKFLTERVATILNEFEDRPINLSLFHEILGQIGTAIMRDHMLLDDHKVVIRDHEIHPDRPKIDV
jgi:hypothetical protein